MVLFMVVDLFLCLPLLIYQGPLPLVSVATREREGHEWERVIGRVGISGVRGGNHCDAI